MISINPPSKDRSCDCCYRLPKELPQFPKGQLLVKTFREMSGCISASWECYDCIGLNKEEWLKKKGEDKFTAMVKEKIEMINGGGE